MSRIGENIMRRRKELGITQEELAFKMGYKSKSSINKIELGLNDIPQSKVVKFAEVLHTSIADLMGWNDEIKKSPVEVVERHFEILMDEDFIGIFEDFKKLNAKEKKIVKELIHNMADTEA